jgi:hypothetical protein
MVCPKLTLTVIDVVFKSNANIGEAAVLGDCRTCEAMKRLPDADLVDIDPYDYQNDAVTYNASKFRDGRFCC